MVFERENSFLEFALHALATRATRTPITEPRGSFTRMLTQLNDVTPLHTVPHIGMLSPLLLDEIACGRARHLPAYMAAVGAPLCGVNLSAAFLDVPHKGVLTTKAVYEKVIDRCLENGGELLNRYVTSKVEVAETNGPDGFPDSLPRAEHGAAERVG
jgi:hypothetical protein